MSKINLYSKPNCPQCDMTKFLLKSENIEFVEKNIMDDEAHVTYLKDLGFMSVPVVIADGIEPIAGFQPDRLKELKAISI
ncbi:glutaredoxin domain-containing protein [Isobaculum melis]|uniref:Ribonucleoside-diphosphate reductase class Ib glutaredoxin subunit n=1 Tax=Isobaculum melis TaxID=142588 RepID=A0A1H9QUB8_9LACT|nr:glutaredoxin domain-containing protein [Isobaculum melis]SER64054.1 ribonucleoside-diphosphate reductase class Ib glutaredoxin subunit [Isobaculum melis]